DENHGPKDAVGQPFTPVSKNRIQKPYRRSDRHLYWRARPGQYRSGRPVDRMITNLAISAKQLSDFSQPGEHCLSLFSIWDNTLDLRRNSLRCEVLLHQLWDDFSTRDQVHHGKMRNLHG